MDGGMPPSRPLLVPLPPHPSVWHSRRCGTPKPLQHKLLPTASLNNHTARLSPLMQVQSGSARCTGHRHRAGIPAPPPHARLVRCLDCSRNDVLPGCVRQFAQSCDAKWHTCTTGALWLQSAG